MTPENKDGILALLGLALVLYAVGMIWVTWVRPTSASEPIFRARWRFGVPASKLGASAIVAANITLGTFCVLGALHSTLAAIPAYVFLAVCVFCIFARLSDMWKDDNQP
jgi:hypothetical protein